MGLLTTATTEHISMGRNDKGKGISSELFVVLNGGEGDQECHSYLSRYAQMRNEDAESSAGEEFISNQRGISRGEECHRWKQGRGALEESAEFSGLLKDRDAAAEVRGAKRTHSYGIWRRK